MQARPMVREPLRPPGRPLAEAPARGPAVTASVTTVRMQDAFAHSPYPYAQGETCRICQGAATHKVGEYTTQNRHEFTAYLCCEHFGSIMGRVATHWCAGEWPAQP